uniref:RRM domain-containing protein n=1 Tax=Chenopodium quinoa TaxID=63459 RepID=A0A803N2G9_CHEQI
MCHRDIVVFFGEIKVKVHLIIASLEGGNPSFFRRRRLKRSSDGAMKEIVHMVEERREEIGTNPQSGAVATPPPAGAVWMQYPAAAMIASVKVIRNKQTGASEGYGFVEFFTHAIADKVLQSYTGHMMPNAEQPFRLNWATFSMADKRTDNGSDLSIFVGDLAADVTDTMLHELFATKYPSVKAAKVVIDANTGRSKGYGFVRFGDDSERTQAMTDMNGVYCSTRPMRIGPATPRKSLGYQQGGYGSSNNAGQGSQSEGDSSNTTIFVGGLDPSVTDEDLRQPFSQYGEIVSVKIPVGKGCGFVQFANRGHAEEALNKLNGSVIGKQTVRLSWGRNPANKQLLKEYGYYQWHRKEDGTNAVGDVLFAHPKAVDLLRLFPYVILIDVTYRTNMYDVPLLEVIGVSSTGQNSHVAFGFMRNEKTTSFLWAMQRVKELFGSENNPGVVVTDREWALMNAVEHVFPSSAHLLCKRHIAKDVERYVTDVTGNKIYAKAFSIRWKKIVDSLTEEEYNVAVAEMPIYRPHKGRPKHNPTKKDKSGWEHSEKNATTGLKKKQNSNKDSKQDADKKSKGHINVRGDGHCGFRVIATFEYGDENKWLDVRRDLQDELTKHVELHRDREVLGSIQEYNRMLNVVNCDKCPAPF